MEPTSPRAEIADPSGTLAACFISYARPDVEHAIGLTRALTTRGHDCWCDVQDLIPGARWQDDVEDALIHCDLVIFLLSPRSLASLGCAAEIRMALELGKKIIPIQIATIEDRSPSLYSDISTFQWIVPIDLTAADRTSIAAYGSPVRGDSRA